MNAVLFALGFVVLPLLAVFVGVHQGRKASNPKSTIVTTGLLWMASAFLFSFPWLRWETWLYTWWNGLGMGFFVALLLHIFPYLLSLWVTRWRQGRKKGSDTSEA